MCTAFDNDGRDFLRSDQSEIQMFCLPALWFFRLLEKKDGLEIGRSAHIDGNQILAGIDVLNYDPDHILGF